jgi:uncharacterized tellurite resistance protein B-like protein
MDSISLILKAHFLRLFQMALADNNFHELEVKHIYKIAQSKGIERQELDRIILSPINLNVLPDDDETILKYLYDLVCVSMADGEVTEDEITIFNRYAGMFGYEEENFSKIFDQLLTLVKSDTKREDVYQILNN